MIRLSTFSLGTFILEFQHHFLSMSTALPSTSHPAVWEVQLSLPASSLVNQFIPFTCSFHYIRSISHLCPVVTSHFVRLSVQIFRFYSSYMSYFGFVSFILIS